VQCLLPAERELRGPGGPIPSKLDEIDINAPLETVWRLHTDVSNWPAWQTDITAARLDGPFEPGSSFTWTSYGFTVTSAIYAVAERARTLWGGTAEGITGTPRMGLHPDVHGHPRGHAGILAGEPVAADITGCNQPWTPH
jgi:hypothetical protein